MLNTAINNPCIDLNTNRRVEASTKTFKHHTLHVHQMVSAMAHKFQLSQQRIHNILQNLVVSQLEAHSHLPTPMSVHQLPTPTKSLQMAHHSHWLDHYVSILHKHTNTTNAR